MTQEQVPPSPGPGTGPVLPRHATVSAFDPATRSGTVLLDDGTEVAFGAAAFDASGLRLLRPGQRVRLERDATGTVELVTIATLG